MQEFLIGRQQIFDRNLKVFAYELLFRDAGGNAPGQFEATWASNQVIVNSLLEEGLERVVGPHRAFINFTRDNLLSGTAQLLPKDKIVVEVLETVAIDDALIQAVTALSKDGFMIALDDFVFSDEWLPLIRLAHVIKLDILASSPETGRRYIERFGKEIKFLAEKVETSEQFSEYLAMGCEYFQGFFFSRPHVLQGRKVGTGHQTVIRLLSEINRSDITMDELAKLVSTDAGLAVKLLRYINSAQVGLGRKVDSIQRAVALVGLKQIQRWANLIALSSFPSTPKELILLSLARAKMCELLAQGVKASSSDEFFMVGLMSMLDQIVGADLSAVLSDLPLSEAVVAALLRREGMLGEALQCAVNYECWNLDSLQFQKLTPPMIGQAYVESVAWANEVAGSFGD